MPSHPDRVRRNYCEHKYNIVAWKNHERIGLHCYKCGKLKLDKKETQRS